MPHPKNCNNRATTGSRGVLLGRSRSVGRSPVRSSNFRSLSLPNGANRRHSRRPFRCTCHGMGTAAFICTDPSCAERIASTARPCRTGLEAGRARTRFRALKCSGGSNIATGFPKAIFAVGFEIARWSSSRRRSGRFNSNCSNRLVPACRRGSSVEVARSTIMPSRAELTEWITSARDNMRGWSRSGSA